MSKTHESDFIPFIGEYLFGSPPEQDASSPMATLNRFTSFGMDVAGMGAIVGVGANAEGIIDQSNIVADVAQFQQNSIEIAGNGKGAMGLGQSPTPAPQQTFTPPTPGLSSGPGA